MTQVNLTQCNVEFTVTNDKLNATFSFCQIKKRDSMNVRERDREGGRENGRTAYVHHAL